MDCVANLLEFKSRHGSSGVESIDAQATALDAARIMNEQRVGSLLVTDENDSPVGILTERDLLTRIIAAERSPSTTLVSAIMSSPIMTCRAGTKLDELRQVMREERIRHVPVVDDHAIVGMVSIGDLNFARSETMVETIRALEAYITSG